MGQQPWNQDFLIGGKDTVFPSPWQGQGAGGGLPQRGLKIWTPGVKS